MNTAAERDAGDALFEDYEVPLLPAAMLLLLAVVVVGLAVLVMAMAGGEP